MNEMIDEAQKLLDEAEALKKLGARPQPVPDSSKMTAHVQIDFKIQNIFGSCDVKFPIRLEGLAYSHGAFSSYEPELFPGLIYRMKQPKIVLLIFVSGKIVLTGAKVRDETYTAFENLRWYYLKVFRQKNMNSAMEKKVQSEPSSSKKFLKKPLDASGTDYDANCNSTAISMGDPRSSTTTMNNLNASILKSDKDSSRMHVFCLEHAIEVGKQLQAIGGAHIILLCHPEYPKIEAEARSLAAEMEVEYDWKDIHFREASMDDRETIQEVLRDEEAIPTNSDWAVKLGINLYYSANLAKSPLYSKQMYEEKPS